MSGDRRETVTLDDGRSLNATAAMEPSGRTHSVPAHPGEHKRGRGRPPTGVPIQVRVPVAVLAAVDARADAEGITRAAWLRNAIAALVE